MLVSNNKVVSFHYRLFNDAKEELESTFETNPSVFLVGAGNTLQGLERAMMGKTKGDAFKVTLEPHSAYGVRTENNKRVSAKHLKFKGKLTPGQMVHLETEQGLQVVTVIKAGKFSVDIDLNHPLAGERLHFNIEITDIREASPEEISHRHVHGVGGHQH